SPSKRVPPAARPSARPRRASRPDRGAGLEPASGGEEKGTRIKEEKGTRINSGAPRRPGRPCEDGRGGGRWAPAPAAPPPAAATPPPGTAARGPPPDAPPPTPLLSPAG